MVKDRFVNIALGAALAGPGVGRRNCYRVGAVLFNKNKVITAKHNQIKTHPALAKFSKFPYLHAETACILGEGLDSCRGLNMLVVRVHKDDETLSCAEPCDVCRGFIKMAGIKNLYYSDWNGNIVKDRINV